MGRFLSGGSGGAPRKQAIRPASNPSVAIPSWARVAYISGTAAGGGGGNASGSNTDRGGGGGAGAFCNRVPLQLNGEASLAVVIGAIGTGAASNSGASGTAAGNVSVTVGSLQLRLQGGQAGGGGAGVAGGGGLGGRAVVGRSDDAVLFPSNGSGGVPWGQTGAGISSGVLAASPMIGDGAPGAGGNLTPRGSGGLSIYGAASRGTEAATTNTGPQAALGYGGGGGGSTGTVAAGDGGPGFILIEFEEATTA